MSQREFRPRGKGIPPANNRLEAGKHRRSGRPPKRLDIDRLLPAFSDRILSSMDDRGVASVSRDQVAQELGLTSWAGKILYRLAVEQGSIQAKGRRTVRGDLVM
jgi:hypothetical protein